MANLNVALSIHFTWTLEWLSIAETIWRERCSSVQTYPSLKRSMIHEVFHDVKFSEDASVSWPQKLLQQSSWSCKKWNVVLTVSSRSYRSFCCCCELCVDIFSLRICDESISHNTDARLLQDPSFFKEPTLPS